MPSRRDGPGRRRPLAEAPRDPRAITFADLGLPEGVVRKLAQNGVTTPFPIQAATIPDALAGKDILGRGRTGSGKTLSFGLPTAGHAGRRPHREEEAPRASSSRRPVSSRCRSRTRSSPTATSSA